MPFSTPPRLQNPGYASDYNCILLYRNVHEKTIVVTATGTRKEQRHDIKCFGGKAIIDERFSQMCERIQVNLLQVKSYCNLAHSFLKSNLVNNYYHI